MYVLSKNPEKHKNKLISIQKCVKIKIKRMNK